MSRAASTSGPPEAPARKSERGILRTLLTLLLVLVVIAAAGVLACFGLGRWLVTEGQLAPARAIAVLSGDMPASAIEAARLYRQHNAPEVWLTHPWGAQQALAPYGIAYTGEQEYNREILEKLGVPAASIRILEPRIVNTADEVRVIAGALRRVNGRRVILVTSPLHTRRVKIIWRKLVGVDPEAIVRYTRAERFNANRWWDSTSGIFDAMRELLGLVNAWAGFPVSPRRPSSFPRPEPAAGAPASPGR